MANRSVRQATPYDLSRIKEIADSEKHALGFILSAILQKSINDGNVYVADCDGRTVGFINFYHRKRDKRTTIYQLAIDEDSRNKGLGKALLDWLEAESTKMGRETLILKTPVDLEANGFFHARGFTLLEVEDGKKRRLNLWQKKLGK